MDDSINLDGKSRFGQVRELYNQDRNAGEWISLETLAKKYNLSVPTLSRVERGKQEPTIRVVKAYHETFNVSVNYLLGIDEDKGTEETTVIKRLGLTDTAATTLKNIVDLSSKENDLSAVVSAFLGNQEMTVGFFQGLLTYLKHDNKEMLSNIFFLSLKEYIETAVKPKLRMVLEKARKEDELIANASDGMDPADTPDE